MPQQAIALDDIASVEVPALARPVTLAPINLTEVASVERRAPLDAQGITDLSSVRVTQPSGSSVSLGSDRASILARKQQYDDAVRRANTVGPLRPDERGPSSPSSTRPIWRQRRLTNPLPDPMQALPLPVTPAPTAPGGPLVAPPPVSMPLASAVPPVLSSPRSNVLEPTAAPRAADPPVPIVPAVTTSPKAVSGPGAELLKIREGGFYANAYKDSKGGPAIGYGMHTFQGQLVRMGQRVTQDAADADFDTQMRDIYLPTLTAALKVPVTQHQFDALASVAWNSPVAAGNLARKLNAGQTLTLKDFLASATEDGKPHPGLRNRRRDEFAQFSAPDAVEASAASATVRPAPMQAQGVTDPASVRVTNPPPPELSYEQIPQPLTAADADPRMGQLVRGTERLARIATGRQVEAPTIAEALNAGSDVLEGAGQLTGPLALAGLIVSLPSTVGTLALTELAALATGKATKAAGASAELQRFLSNVAATATAVGGAKVVLRAANVAAAETTRAAKAAARPLALSAQLSRAGYGPGDVPGARGVPFADVESKTSPVVTESAVRLEDQIRAEGVKAAAEAQQAREATAPAPPATGLVETTPLHSAPPTTTPVLDVEAALRDLAVAPPNSPQALTAIAGLKRAGLDLPTITARVQALQTTQPEQIVPPGINSQAGINPPDPVAAQFGGEPTEPDRKEKAVIATAQVALLNSVKRSRNLPPGADGDSLLRDGLVTRRADGWFSLTDKGRAALAAAGTPVEPIAATSVASIDVPATTTTQAERNGRAKAEAAADGLASQDVTAIASGRALERRLAEGVSPTGAERRTLTETATTEPSPAIASSGDSEKRGSTGLQGLTDTALKDLQSHGSRQDRNLAFVEARRRSEEAKQRLTAVTIVTPTATEPAIAATAPPEVATAEPPPVDEVATKHGGVPVERSLSVRVYDALTKEAWPTVTNAGAFRKTVAERLGVPEQTLVDDIDALNDGAEAALLDTFQPSDDLAETLIRARKAEALMPHAHRTLEKTKLQQFSTPLPIAVMAARAADVHPGDRVLEPTAGTGNLLAPLKDRTDVTIAAIELGARRADLLRAQGFRVVQGDYLGAHVRKATVIISNPPWGKYTTGKYGKAIALGYTPSDVAERFVGKMMRDLDPNGRLVAVMPTTMLTSPSFKAWLRDNYTVRAIIQSPPGAYDTRATTVDSLLLVVDNTRPEGGRGTLPAVVVAKDWQAYAGAVGEIAPREHIPEPAERSAVEAPRAAPGGGPGDVSGPPSRPAESGRHAPVPSGRDTGVVADERGPTGAGRSESIGPGVVEQPERATLDALSTSEGEFADVVDHAPDESAAAGRSREFAPYVRRTALRGVGHPKLVVEARQLAGVSYPPLTLKPGRAILTALREKRVSVEQAEQALAAVQANIDGHHGYLAADNVGVGKSREIALTILDLMERAKADGRELRLIVTTKSSQNIRDLIDNELYYVATGRTKEGLDLLNVDAPKVAPQGLPFEVVETAAWPDAKREGQEYKPLPTYKHALYVTDFFNLSDFRQGLVDINPHGIIGDEAHRFKNVEGAAAGGAWQNLHATIIRGVPREEQVFAYFTATPAQTVNDYQYLYGLRLWPIDGFAQWANVATGGGDEKAQAELEAATEKGAFNLDRVAGNTGPDVVGGDSEDVGGKKASVFAAASFADVFTSRLTPAEAEQIPREWKMLGRFSSRDLWRAGQEFIIHEAKLSPAHAATYDKFTELAQDIARKSFQFGLLDKTGKSSRFGVTGQLQFAAKRIQMQPALEEAIRLAQEKVAQGYQVVLSVINVTEMDPEKGNIAAAIEKINTRIKDVDPDDPDGGDIDLGEIPEALVARAELLEQAKALGKFDDPIEMVEQAFGRNNVAFIVGSDTATARRVAMKAFQEGQRQVAFLSAAGSTGINLDHRVLTDQGPGHGRRVFIDVQFEWSATEAIQRYGRVGRAASVTQPVLMPLTFGNASEKKFLATIANRMSALGALSKGGAESTGASGLEEFEITGADAAQAARLAYNDLGAENKRKFAVIKSVFRSPNRGKADPFEPAATAPASSRMQDFQLALLFVPLKTSNAFWESFLRHRTEVRAAMGLDTTSRTEAYQGEILRTSDLGTADKPLTLTEVKNQKGQRFGVLSGLITPRMPILRQFLYAEDSAGHRSFSRKYVTFTAGKQIVAGLQIPWGKVHALAETFEVDLSRDKLDTPAKVFAALRANENLELAQETDDGVRWIIGLRKDGKIRVTGPKMAERALLLHNGGAYSPVGNFWFTTEENLPQFLERFPLYEAPSTAPKPRASSSGGTTIKASVLPGAGEFVEQDVLPALKTAATTFAEVAEQARLTFAPSSVGPGKQAAGALRAKMAAEAQANARTMRAAREFQTAFDRLVSTAAGREQAIDWWDAVQTGAIAKILPALKPAYDFMRRELDALRDEVQKFGKLEEFNEYYFPQIWKFPKEEAQWVRRKLAGLMGKRPFEGSKGFLKRRKYPTFREGLEALQPKGIEPISYNPVDHFMVKVREMRRYVVARQAIEDFQALGIWKPFGGVGGGAKPDGWTRIEGALGTIYGPPTVQVKEAFDPDLFEGLETFARSLGVDLSRRVNIGGRRWGYAEGARHITTKAAGPEGVLMHEIGHILDEYGLRGMVKAKKFRQELRDLADLRHEGTPKEQVRPGRLRYERKGEEKIANLVHAFLYAPDRAKRIAPNSYWALYNLTKDHKELRPLRDLQKTRSLKLGIRSHEINIGGFPEIGYYAMPDDAARIFNNHLSRGLAGRSAIFDAYRWLNNTMVTGQLAASGVFHLTFTGLDALASQGGLALQELVGGVEQRKPKMVLRGAGRAAAVLGSGVVGGAAGYAIGGPLGILWASGYPLGAMKFIKGWRGKRAWLTQDPAGRFFNDQVRVMNEGGFRPTWDEFYDHGAMKNALRALRSGNYPGALARTIPAMLDAVTRPVMSWWVPAMKTANYLDAAAFELDRLAGTVARVEAAERELAGMARTPAEKKVLRPEAKADLQALEAQHADDLAVIRSALNRVQASMDNRFGEVVYDNWFWQRWLKDVAHILLRSPGWQAGTYKGVIGGVLQQAARTTSQVSGLIGGGGRGGGAGGGPAAGATAGGKGQPGDDRESILAGDMAWILALIAMSMLMGGMTHYLSTGERPKERDWLYPKGPDGKRRQILTYLPRLVSAFLHPIRTAVGISAPLNTVLARVFVTNETWSGEIIRETGDPWFDQARDALRFAVTEGYQPFLASNIQRGEGAVESFMGVAPAAGEWQRSKAENYLHDIMPQFSLTHEEADRRQARRDLRAGIVAKDPAAIAAAVTAGGLPRASVLRAVKAAQQTYLQRAFGGTTLDQALHAYALGTPEERYVMKPLLARKAHSLLPQVPARDRASVVARFTAAMKMSVARPVPPAPASESRPVAAP